MQTLAAYLFKADIESAQVSSRADVVDNEISAWLGHKGAEEPTAPQGRFISKTGDGQGRFVRGIVKSKSGKIETTTLVEFTHTGLTFTTNIQVICEESSITFFSTLSAFNEKKHHQTTFAIPKMPTHYSQAHNNLW